RRLFVAHLRSRGRRPRRLLIGVLRAPHLPMIETVISSIRKRTAIAVPWRPVLKQVRPWRSRKLAAVLTRCGLAARKDGAAQQRVVESRCGPFWSYRGGSGW